MNAWIHYYTYLDQYVVACIRICAFIHMVTYIHIHIYMYNMHKWAHTHVFCFHDFRKFVVVCMYACMHIRVFVVVVGVCVCVSNVCICVYSRVRAHSHHACFHETLLWLYMHVYMYVSHRNVFSGCCCGLYDGDALTLGSRQPLAAVGSLHRSDHRSDLHL